MTIPPSPGFSPGPGPHPGVAAAAGPEAPGFFNGATTHGIIGQKQIRHPWEVPLLAVTVVVTGITYILWLILFIWFIVGTVNGSDPLLVISALPFVGQIFLVLPLLPIILFWGRAILYAQQRARAVRMSPTQFPEGFRMVAEAAQQFGLRRMPDAYVLSGSGVINAFAAGHGFRRHVLIHSDLFEAGGPARDPEALRFVIAHEVGHIAAGHVSYFRILLTSLLLPIPFLPAALSRAQEYTADNYGYAHTPSGATGAVGLLAGGKYLNAEVNVHELAERAAEDISFFVHWVNLGSSHPVITWRAHALRDRSKPGAILIRPNRRLGELALPSGHLPTAGHPTPAQALAMLNEAARVRSPGSDQQFGRFPGADYSHRPPMRDVQLAVPLLSRPTGQTIPPGPYKDDATGQR